MESMYGLLENINVKGFRHMAEVPIVGYDGTMENEFGEEVPKPVYDDFDKAPERFGMLADDDTLPVFLRTKDRTAISGGRVASYNTLCLQVAKAKIEALEARIAELERN